MKKAISKLAMKYSIGIPSLEQTPDNSAVQPLRISEMIRLKTPAEFLVKYEQILIYWAKLLVAMNRFAELLALIAAFDCSHFYTNDVNFLKAVLYYENRDYTSCLNLIREVLREETNHQECLVLYAQIYFKSKDHVT